MVVVVVGVVVAAAAEAVVVVVVLAIVVVVIVSTIQILNVKLVVTDSQIINYSTGNSVSYILVQFANIT